MHAHARPPTPRRLPVKLLPDAARVVARPFVPGDFIFPGGKSRMKVVVDRVLALSDAEVERELGEVLTGFGSRHLDLNGLLEEHARRACEHVVDFTALPPQRRRLLGAYFTHEYAVQAAALFNPSMVPAPDQNGVPAGALRFIVSLRAVGEGHISSIEFRNGIVTAEGEVLLDKDEAHAVMGTRRDPLYHRSVFAGKLAELGADQATAERILSQLASEFTMADLEAALFEFEESMSSAAVLETVRLIHWLASSNYIIEFPPDSRVGERVLVPSGPTESRGMEDARFVRFTEDDGAVTYYATYTAFDGLEILPQLIETAGFCTFRVATLNGDGAQNKGMALFPRRINGRYVALSRNDRESLFLMSSDEVRWWYNPVLLRGPRHPWELVQMGNCGSPIETEAGWLVLTHGVGALRRYSVGALLLDRDDPHRIIGDLPEPLLTAAEDERDGYVPNVVYSCGGLVHAGRLVIPYGFADLGTRFATVELDPLLEALLANPPRSGA